MSELDRLAVIEVGTRGIRLLVVERRDPPDGMEVLQSRGELSTLGEGLDKSTGYIHPDNLQASLEPVRRFLRMAQVLGADRVLMVGTHVFRRARNVDEFRALVPKPLTLLVLTPEEEAAGAFLAACWGLRKEGLTHGQLVVIDLGGGSLEVVGGLQGNPPLPITSASMGTMGILALREVWMRVANSADPEQGLREYIDAELGRHSEAFAAFRHPLGEEAEVSGKLLVAGLGSTVTDAAWLLSGRPLSTYKSREVNGLRLSRPDLERWRSELPGEPAQSALAVELKDPLAHQLGLAALVGVMDALGTSAITACGTGLRFGLAYAFLHGITLAIATTGASAHSDHPARGVIGERLRPGH